MKYTTEYSYTGGDTPYVVLRSRWQNGVPVERTTLATFRTQSMRADAREGIVRSEKEWLGDAYVESGNPVPTS